MKQYETVILTLEKLSGVATLGQLNQETLKVKDCIWKTKTPFASIRFNKQSILRKKITHQRDN